MTQVLNGLDETAHSSAFDHTLAKDMAEALLAAYPGHLWAVSADSTTGMCDIRDLLLSGEYGYRLKIPNIYSASAFKADVVRAGGEILERFSLSRGRFDEGQYSGLKTTFSGDFVFDKS
jgi:hypothetical protein